MQVSGVNAQIAYAGSVQQVQDRAPSPSAASSRTSRIDQSQAVLISPQTQQAARTADLLVAEGPRLGGDPASNKKLVSAGGSGSKGQNLDIVA